MDEIANSKYSFINSSPMTDGCFDVGLRLGQVKKMPKTLDKAQTHLRRVSDDIADAKRRMTLRGLGARYCISGRWTETSSGSKVN